MLTVAAALGTAGCGDDDGASTTATGAATTEPAPAATSGPATTAPPAPTTAPAPAVTTPGPTTTSPEDQPGGAGDEQPAVVPAVFTIAAGGVTPPRVEVPAFFTIRVTGVSQDGQAHTIAFRGKSADVPAGGRASLRVTGLKAGEYPVTIDGDAGAATIAVGAEPGP